MRSKRNKRKMKNPNIPQTLTKLLTIQLSTDSNVRRNSTIKKFRCGLDLNPTHSHRAGARKTL